MWRAVFEAAIPFLVPFALYAFWLAAMKRANPVRDAATGGVRTWPWLVLSCAGLVLAFAVLAITAGRDAISTNERYAPARISGGEILPGGAAPR